MGKRVVDEVTESKLLRRAATEKLAAAKDIAEANLLLDGADANGAHATATLEGPEPLEPTPTKLERVIAELQGEGKFLVYRVLNDQRLKIGTYPIAEYPDQLDRLAKRYGGGDFEVEFRDEQGHFVTKSRQTFDPEAYRSDAPAGAGAPAADLSRVLDRMDRMAESHRLEMERMRTENMNLLLKLVDASRPQQRSTEDMIEMFKLAQEMNKPAASPLSSIKEVLEIVSTLQENSLGEPPSPMTKAVDKAFALLSPMLAAWAKKLEAKPEPQPQERAALAAPAAPAAPAVKKEVAPAPAAVAAPDPVDPRVMNYAQSLLTAVKSGATAEEVANGIFGFIGDKDDDLDQLSEMVNDPGLAATLLRAEPQLLDHQGWLAATIACLKDGIEEVPEDDGSEPQAAGAEPTEIGSSSTAPEASHA